MNPWFLQQVSQSEKENILSKHRELYNGYQTMQPKVSNEQPLYVQDFAKDKDGAVLNNKGVVKPYTNVGINEQFDNHMTEEKEMCTECGGTMNEGECSECGWKNEMIEEKEGSEKSKFEKWMEKDEDTKLEKALKKFGDFLIDLEDKIDGVNKEKQEANEGVFDVPLRKIFNKRDQRNPRIPYEPEAIEKITRMIQDAKTEEHLNAAMKMFRTLEEMNPEMNTVYKERVINNFKRKADELGYYLRPTKITETTGKLDDIYKIKDLNLKGEFDYVEGDDNYEGSWEQMHSKKKKSLGEDEHMSDSHVSKITPPYEHDKGFVSDGPSGDGGTLRQKNVPGIGKKEFELDEQGFTGGGNAPDMDLSNIDPAFNFDSEGPEEDTFTIPVPVDDMDLDEKDIKKPYEFVSGGGNENGGDVYPVYEEMKSAWDDDNELDEEDISGAQASQTSAKKPYAYVSTGPGKAGPYQTHSWGGEEIGEEYEGEDEDAYWEEDLAPNELDLDLTKFNPEDKSWEEITSYTGEDEFAHVNEEIQEDLVRQKNKVNEMMERMKRFN